MNITRNIFLVAATAAGLFASVPLAQAQAPQRSPGEIDQIVGPIALYPDPLVSIMLPAATLPDEVQQAANLVGNGETAAIERAPWDDSVRAVAHYPDLVVWMSDNIDWTAQLGATFAAQPGDVLNSVQRLRARALAVGTLVDTPQQRVVLEGELIAIVPAEPAVIYVPRYDPAMVYVDHPMRRGASVFSFSAGFAVGAWLTYDFDWRRHSLFVADRAWAERRDWSRPSFSAVNARETHREWRPAPNRASANVNVTLSRTVVTPRIMGERNANSERRPAMAGQVQGTVSQNQPPAAPTTANNNNTAQTNISIRDRERMREQNRAPGMANQNNTVQNPVPTTSTPPRYPAAAPAPDQGSAANTAILAGETSRERDARAREQSQNRALSNGRPSPAQTEREKNALANEQAKASPSYRAGAVPPAGMASATERINERASVKPAAPSVTPPATPNQNKNESFAAHEAQVNVDERKKAEVNRRPTPRGSITAGASGEYPTPAENPARKEVRPNPTNLPPAATPTERDRAMTPTHPTPEPQRPTPQVKTPASTPPAAPAAQNKTETEEEKAKRLQQDEEEKKKKKKPDDSHGG